MIQLFSSFEPSSHPCISQEYDRLAPSAGIQGLEDDTGAIARLTFVFVKRPLTDCLLSNPTLSLGRQPQGSLHALAHACISASLSTHTYGAGHDKRAIHLLKPSPEP
jgi:hypothetical protein